MRGYNCYEKIKVYRTTNRVCSEAGGDGHSGCRSVPQDRHFGGDVFQPEAKVFRVGNRRTQAAQADRRRELQTQTGHRRPKTVI